MLSYLRGAFTAVAFVLLSGIAIAAAMQTFSIGLPSSMPTNATALLAALRTQDMSRMAEPEKVKLGDRLQRELAENVDWPAELKALSPEERDRLLDNVNELAIASFDSKVERFFQKPEHERPRFVDRQIDEIIHWAVVLDRVTRTEGEPLMGPAALAGLMSKVGHWYQGASPEKIARLQAFQKVVADRIPKRLMKKLRPMDN